jgi:hypothetical protein
MEVVRIDNITFSDVYEQFFEENEKEEVCETLNPREQVRAEAEGLLMECNLLSAQAALETMNRR